ncbi:MAG: O-acetyl-ADP-ribose deacetylase [Candidatus Omnitrophica bacterium]|nr:O-acetyl-ADP-ribose deacetylase [Candidatus Omnitrophota bacterium]
MGRIIIKKGDITREDAEVIVNAANTGLRGGGGVDGAIHRAAGPMVMEECKKIGGCKTGEAVMTAAGNLKANKIIHTPGPVWHGGESGEADLLRNCYKNSFELAKKNSFKTIAFPAISTGVYGYPVREAAEIAVTEGVKYTRFFNEIRYVCFSDGDFEVYNSVMEKLKKKT